MTAWQHYWLLLKTQLPSVLRGRQKESGETKRSQVGYNLIIAVAMLVVLGTVTIAYIGMAEALQPIGQLSVIPTIAMAGGSLFCLFTTIYKTNGLLFGFQDYDLVMSLPVRSSIVVAVRLTILYVYNLLFLLAVMVPAGVVYGIYAGAGFWFFLVFAVETLLTPLVPVVIATFLGTLIAMAASRFQRRGIAGIILTLLFMVAWMMFVYNTDSVIEQFARYGPQLNAWVASAYPPAGWFAEGCCNLNMGAFALFAALSIGLFAAFCWLVGRYYRAVNSMLTSFSAQKKYSLKPLRSAGVRKALLYKEFKRLTASTNYFLNAAIGPIMGIVIGALICFGMAGSFADLADMAAADMDPGIGYAMVALFMGFMTGMSECAAVSISIEGRQLWIIKSAPVSTQDILRAKRQLNLILSGIGAVGAGLLLMFNLPFSILYSPALILTPLICGVFATMWGQKLNLRFARFDWTSEMQIVKRSKPVTFLMLTTMALVLGSILLCAVIGSWVMFAVDGLLLIWSWIAHHWIVTKGTAVFDAYSA